MASGCKGLNNWCKLNQREMKNLKKFQLLKEYIGKILLITTLDSREQLSMIRKMVSGCKEMKNLYKLKHKEMKKQKKFQQLKVYIGKILLITTLDSKEQLSTIKKMVSGCKKMMSFYKLKQIIQLLSILMVNQKKFKLLKVKPGEHFTTVVIQLLVQMENQEPLGIIKWRNLLNKCKNLPN